MKFPFIIALSTLSSIGAFIVKSPTICHRPLFAERNGEIGTKEAPSFQVASPMRSDISPKSPLASQRSPLTSQRSPLTSPKYGDVRKTSKEAFDKVTPITVQGGSLKTCSIGQDVKRVSIYMQTKGRPVNANVELWQGPENAPQKMSVYLEDGSKRPFRASVESPGSSNSIAIRNTGQMEFPLTVGIDVDVESEDVGPSEILLGNSDSRVVQGGAVYTTPFPPAVQSVQVALKSDGRPLNARVELLQGPNNNKQVMEIYTEDGNERPFFVIIDTPGSGNVVRIVNTATVEFPLTAAVEPYLVDEFIVESSSGGGLHWS